jgi:hypothetical protein
MMFCPMETTGIAMVFTGVVRSPIRRLAGVTILTEFCTRKKRIEGVGGMNWRALEHERLWGVWRRRSVGRGRGR